MAEIFLIKNIFDWSQLVLNGMLNIVLCREYVDGFNIN